MVRKRQTRLVDGEGGRIEVGESADLVPGVLAILVLEVAGKVLEDEPVHLPLLSLVPACSFDRVPESNGDGDRADDVLRGRESREGSCTQNRTSCPSRAGLVRPRRTGCRAGGPADRFTLPLPSPISQQLVREFVSFVPRRAREVPLPQGSAKLIRASSDKNAFGVKRGERGVRLCFGSGAMPSLSTLATPPPSLARSLVRRKERNDGGHQFRFKIVYRGAAADAIDGR